MTNWGFLKCSKNECDKTLARLADELRAAGADEVIVEKGCTEKDMPARLKFLLNTASKGDTLVALSASRLCKTSAQLLKPLICSFLSVRFRCPYGSD